MSAAQIQPFPAAYDKAAMERALDEAFAAVFGKARAETQGDE